MSNHGEESTPEVSEFVPTRNYTGENEKGNWWYIKRWGKDNKSVSWFSPFWINKEEFRQRRNHFYGTKFNSVRINIQNNNEVGAFFKLTNSYALVATESDPQMFHNTVKGDLSEIPVISTTLSGCNIVGCLSVGNSKGLLLPETIYETEIDNIKEQLPDSVKISKLEEQLSALGNVIACNDNFAIIHPEISKETEEIIADVLQVEVFRTMLGKNPLVGSYSVFNNLGGLIHSDVSSTDLANLSSLLDIPISIGTVNYGCKVVGAGLVVNDSFAYAGMKTTAHEFSVIDSTFQLKKK